jgi:hypothetical protein
MVAVGMGVGVANVGHLGNLLDSEIACGGKRGADGDGEVVEGMGKIPGRSLVTGWLVWATRSRRLIRNGSALVADVDGIHPEQLVFLLQNGTVL